MAFTKFPITVEETRERKRIRAHAAYHANAEKCRTAQNERRAANPEAYRADQKARRAADLERYRGYGRDEQLRRRLRLPWLASFHACRKRAKKKGIEFSLTYAWATETYTGRCAITGIEFEVRAVAGKPGPRPRSVSIDRIDQTEGYTRANCRFLLNAVNTMRGAGTDEDMLALAKVLCSKGVV